MIKYFLIGIIALLLISKSNFNSGFAPPDSGYIQPVVYKNIITELEGNYILSNAEKKFKDSEIVGGFDNSIRKSKTTWLYPSDPIIKNIIKRICDMTEYPFKNAEPLQVVKYEAGGFYNEHHDSCCEDDPKCETFAEKSGQRVVTMLIYLNDSFTGGSTNFPKLNIDIKPPKYGGILFRPLEKDGTRCHPLALHKGMPILSGVKYVCNVWIRELEFL